MRRQMKFTCLMLAISGLLTNGAGWTCHAQQPKVVSNVKNSEPLDTPVEEAEPVTTNETAPRDTVPSTEVPGEIAVDTQPSDGLESEDFDGRSRSSGKTKSKAGGKLPKRPSYLRLPRYFAGLVDEQQRSRIQEIQLQFRTQIDQLEQALSELRQREQLAIEQLLTPAQRKLLEKKRLPVRATVVEADPAEHVDPSSDQTAQGIDSESAQ